MSRRGLFFILLGLLLLSAPSMAQTFGEITGVVADSSGAVVGGATVTITNPQTNFTRRAVSRSSEGVRDQGGADAGY